MEFGRVQENELNSIDFFLHAAPAYNKNILKGNRQRILKYMPVVPNGAERNG